MVVHIRVHVSLIVADDDRSGALVVGREIIPVPGRTPDLVVRTAEIGVDHRDLDEHGVDYVVVAIDIAVADHLDIGARLSDHSRYILEDVRCQASLDDEQVGASFHGLENTEIVYVAIPVEVKVVEHVGRIVQEPLEVLDAGRLGERGRDSLQVKEQGNVLAGGDDARGRRDHLGFRHRHSGAVAGDRGHRCHGCRHNRFGIGSHCHDPRQPASRAEQGKEGDC